MIRKKIIIFGLILITILLIVLQDKKSHVNKSKEEKSFVIVIPSYNNSEWYERNLHSVFMQQYSNYRVIYIDDYSSDKTYEFVKSYIEQHDQINRVTLIRNSTRRGAMANHFKAGHMCEDYEIIVDLDGDDWFKDEYVLQKLNKVYADPNVWMTYGQFEKYPGGRQGFCREFPTIIHEKNLYREYEWISSHLRSFYAWLFKRIRLKDCLYRGMWLPVNCDKVIMFSLLEMARDHSKFIPDVLYVYNCATPLNDYKQYLISQRYYDKVIDTRKKYARVKQAPDLTKSSNKDAPIALVIFSEDNPMLLYALLESVHNYFSGPFHINVLFHTNTDRFEKGYNELKKLFDEVSFYAYQQGSQSSLPCVMEKLIGQTQYVLFARDGIIIKEPIDLQRCIHELEKTSAYGFYLTLGKNITRHYKLCRQQKLPPFIDLENDMYAWQFDCGEYDWKKPHTISLGLYRTADIKKAFSNVVYDNPVLFEELWQGITFDMSHVGLAFECSPALILENPLLQSTLLGLFEEGFKLDLSCLLGITNQAMHIEKEMHLLNRETIC
ncbi:glycosyltransferase family 2 protein [Candidatus Dependentiae bacterium]|nr:MAG: glycosyltransferase family 2 protein [Candidatus Dependentiae bacterium]